MAASTPDGFAMVELPLDTQAVLLDQSLAELAPRFKISSVVEIGISYRIAESKRRLTVGLPLAKFPATLALVGQATSTLRKESLAEEFPGEGLNVICRRYTAGDSLGFHRDSVGLFNEDIFGAVLTSSGPGLVFRRRVGEERQEYSVPETAGCIFVSTGASRYAWSHGVLPRPADSAVRVSLTWRWLRPATIRWFRIASCSRAEWVAKFVRDALAEGTEDHVLAAFLCSTSSWYCTKNDRLGPLLSSEEVKDALGLESLPATKSEDVRSAEHLKLRLDMLRSWERAMVPLPAASSTSHVSKGSRASRRAVASAESDSEDSPLQFLDLFDLPPVDAAQDEGETSSGSSARAVPTNRFAAFGSSSEDECS